MKVPRRLKELFRHLLVAILVGGILVVADYLGSNASYPLLDGSGELSLYAYLFDNGEVEHDFVGVNVAYDKELVPVVDEWGDSLGSVAITSRPMLAKFLKTIEGADYKYIFLDVRFEDGLESPADSLLFGYINRMPRLVYSTHREDDEYAVDRRLLGEKAGMADYRHERQSGFSRYEFIQDGRESVALRMYNELDGGKITPRCLGYVDDGKLCYDTQFLKIPRTIVVGETEDGELLYPYLSGQLMAKYTDEELKELVKDRFVIIGDFDNDRHESYIGDIPGPMLSYYSYKALHQGLHRVSKLLYLFLWMIFAGITFAILEDIQVLRFKKPWISFVTSFLGWGLVLSVIQILLFVLAGLSFSVLLPTLTFSTFSLIKQYKDTIKT